MSKYSLYLNDILRAIGRIENSIKGPGDPTGLPNDFNGNIYKIQNSNIFRIFPGDPTGLPDDFFLNNYLNFGGILLKWKKH